MNKIVMFLLLICLTGGMFAILASDASELTYSAALLNEAKAGNLNSQIDLGTCYLEGLGVAKNPTEAFNWTKKAALQGDTESQYNVGYFYYSGEGVAKNYTEAVNWFRKAADKGFADAQFNLGVCYTDGT